MHDADGMATTEAGPRAAGVLDELYRRHVGEVFRYAYAMLGNRADAEDVAQTTFMNALRALERGERPRRPSSWLLTIARNIVRQRFRQSQARPTEVELDRELAAVEPDDAGPTVDEVLKALARIPIPQREAIVMREFEGRPYAEIATILDISTSALETLLFRARRSLAEELENVVTCEQAELAISRRLDERLSRKERRRLEQHLKECPTCARFEQVQRRGRRAFRGLALLPIPASLTLFKGTHEAAAAASLPTIGAASSGAAVATGAGAAGGGVAVGGLAVKAAAAVATLGIAGGVSYTGVQELRDERPPPVQPAAPVKSEPKRDTEPTARPLASGSVRTSVSDRQPVEAKLVGKARAAQAKAAKQARKDRSVHGQLERTRPRGSAGLPDRLRGSPRRERPARASIHTRDTNTVRGKRVVVAPRQLKAPRVGSKAQQGPARTRKNVAPATAAPTAAKKLPGRGKREKPAPSATGDPAAGSAVADGKPDNSGGHTPHGPGGGKKVTADG